MDDRTRKEIIASIDRLKLALRDMLDFSDILTAEQLIFNNQKLLVDATCGQNLPVKSHMLERGLLAIQLKDAFQAGAEPDLVEECAEAVHEAYCEDYLKKNGMPYWTNGDYSQLSDETKETDRASVRAVLETIQGSDGSGKISDGYHTFNELYKFREMYNACLFNEWAAKNRHEVHKSKRHFDGEECFGGGWFIVVAILPGGQVSNHYEMKDWDLFSCPETERALYEFDGHGTQDVIDRLREVALSAISFPVIPSRDPVSSGSALANVATAEPADEQG